MTSAGFHSVSLPDEDLELVDRIGPKLRALPKDGRRRDSRATWISAILHDYVRLLEERGILLPQRQAPLQLYDEGGARP